MKLLQATRVFAPDGSVPWAKNTATTPTPVRIDDTTIRVFAGMRDDLGVSRIGYVDVDANNPSRVKGWSRTPVLDTGRPGMFDDNGMILGDVVRVDRDLYMYYVGFQHAANVKFLAFTGLAVSKDNGRSFVRESETPVFDRGPEAPFIRAIHGVLYEPGRFRIWYTACASWETIKGKPYPSYLMYYAESEDGIHITPVSGPILPFAADEYRIGRPRVFAMKNGYGMMFTKGTRRGDYLPAFAFSPDGKSWTRNDAALLVPLSKSGWDSAMRCYLAPIDVDGTRYVFFNGNGMGYTGFGCGILEGESI